MDRIIKIIDELIDDNIGKVQLINGGSINESFKVLTDKGQYFIKLNDKFEYDDFFYIEAKSLEILKETNTFRIPKVEKYGKEFLMLEFLKSGEKSEAFWMQFAVKLATLHRYSSECFGLDFDNYIGSLKQSNTPSMSWSEFFTTQRIMPLVRLAYDQEKLDGKFLLKAEKFCNRLDDLFPKENPALLHGDLWSGNCMSSENGVPVIFDPAIYFGHREMDIAMTNLFGGFGESFYHYYNSAFPLEKGWEGRTKYCNVYPLLVHVILFGGNYVSELKEQLIEF